jgi:hypothetical protein
MLKSPNCSSVKFQENLGFLDNTKSRTVVFFIFAISLFKSIA